MWQSFWMKMRFYLPLGFACILLGACSWTSGDSDEVDVRVISLQKMEPMGLEQGFELGLKIINPTDEPLTIKGLVFDMELDGYRLLSGVQSPVPIVPPYSEVSVTAHTSISLINSLRFFNEIATQPKDTFKFNFRARVDMDTWWPKSIVIKRDGVIRIAP